MGKGGQVQSPFVWNLDRSARIYIEPIRSRNGIALHKAVTDSGLYTVSHLGTGSALFKNQDLDVALAFFEKVADWPEWMQGHTTTDFQFLRPRVEAVRIAALTFSRFS